MEAASFRVEFDTDRLKDAKINRAFSELTRALGGHDARLVSSDAPKTNGQDARATFFNYLRGRKDTRFVTVAQAVRFFEALERVGAKGLSPQEALNFFPLVASTDNGKVYGGILGGLVKGLKGRNLPIPFNKVEGRTVPRRTESTAARDTLSFAASFFYHEA